MSDLKACRVCLRTKCKMYKYDRFQLKSYYEEITEYEIKPKDGMPNYFCVECATTLHKVHSFKNKCEKSHRAMKDFIKKGRMTYEAIKSIQATCPELKSALDIIAPTNRVKTYIKSYVSKKVVKSKKDSRKRSLQVDYNPQIEVTNVSCEISDDDYTEPIADDFLSTVPIDDPVVSKEEEEEAIASERKPESSEIEPLPEVTVHVEALEEGVTAFETKTEEFTETEVKLDEKVFASDSSDDECIAKKVSKKKVELESPAKEEDEPPLKKSNPNARPAFTKQRKRFLDPQHWKQYTLSPEDAKQQFYGKAFDDKYLQSSFKCTDCLKGFSKEDIWKRHRVLLHAESKGRHTCPFCRLRFKIDSHLRRHLRLHYTRYQCQRCHMVFNNQEIALLHDDNHSGTNKFKCSICEHEFKHQSTYYTHMRTVHRSEFVCTLCGAAFVSQLGLKKHTKIKHCLTDDKSKTESIDSATFCDLCNITFETRAAYEFHKHNSVLHGNDMKGSNGQRKREFKSRPGKKPTNCTQCGMQFSTQSACMQHHQRAHPGTPFDPQRHVCEICGASLAPGSLAMHMNIHSRENLFPCETCGKTFYSKAGLQRHHVTHTGEKPFACTLCDKRFTQNDSMKLHYRTYHLKQPYPKRNRSKKQEISEVMELKMPGEPVFYLK